MSTARVSLALLALLMFASLCPAQDAAAVEKKKAEAAAKERKKLEAELAKIDAQIKKTPEDPTVHCRRAQALMKLDRWDDGYAAAQKTMEWIIKKGDDLASLLLESIDLGVLRVDVHFNMGARERKPPEMGIVRPLSFRIMRKADPAVKDSKDELVETIDFELGYMGGKPGTAAFGKMEGATHKNLGMQEVEAAYRNIRTNAIELIKKRNPPDEPK